jgi:glycosyltransferase involved in cell wall biosynthesis
MTVAQNRHIRLPLDRTDGFIAMVSEHASPLATLGGEDAGGQNIHVAMLAGALADRGHEVVVYTRRDDASLPERVRLRRGVIVEHLDAGPPQAIAKDELRTYVPEMSADLQRRWLRRTPAVVHAHFWMSGLAALPPATELGIPIVQTFHALGTVKRRMQGEHDGSPADRIASERALAGAVDRVIATCSDEVSELQAIGLLDRRVDVVPCGVDVKQFQPLGPRARRTTKHRLISVGRLVRRKGVDDVIDALTWLPDTELLVVGGPPAAALDADEEARRLRHQAESRGVSSRVRLVGGVDRAGVAELMRSADLAVCAPWYEPFGIVPLEAMACGVPVVATAVGGLLDTVSDGVTGRHVPPRRPDLLARTVAELLADPQRREAMGAAGVRRVARRYTWQQVARLTERSYARVVDQAHGWRGAARSAGECTAVSELSA